MRFTSVTFSLENTLPLFPLSRSESDQYANLKPCATVTVEFNDDDDTKITQANLERAKGIVKEAFDQAQKLAFDEISDFRKEMREMYKR